MYLTDLRTRLETLEPDRQIVVRSVRRFSTWPDWESMPVSDSTSTIRSWLFSRFPDDLFVASDEIKEQLRNALAMKELLRKSLAERRSKTQDEN